jgi:hypothetical protein
VKEEKKKRRRRRKREILAFLLMNFFSSLLRVYDSKQRRTLVHGPLDIEGHFGKERLREVKL